MFNKSAIKERKQIIHLLHKHVKGELTLKEHTKLKIWAAKSEENLKLLYEVTNQQALASDMVALSNFDWNNIAQRLASNGLPIFDDVPVRRAVHLGWFIAAAAVFLVIVAVYLLQEKKPNPSTVDKQEVAATTNDISPGKYKARLTLADGSTLLLDSMNSDSLTRQGAVKLANKNGQLVYAVGGKNGGNSSPIINTLTTAKGETYQLLLSDGSKVWINSGSSIRFPVYFTGKERRVEVSGEAFFEVSHNLLQPFIAQVNGMDVKVMGTVFNINAYKEEKKMITTLLKGKVQVAKDKSRKVLTPGEQAEVLPSGTIQVNKDADVDKAVGWKNGLFVFKGDDVRSVMNQLARWYDVNVLYKGVIKDRFTGIINRDLPVSVVLDMLQKSTVHFRIEGRTIIVTP